MFVLDRIAVVANGLPNKLHLANEVNSPAYEIVGEVRIFFKVECL
jgi:hypothetical protein